MRRAGPSRRTCGVAVRPRKALMAMAMGLFTASACAVHPAPLPAPTEALGLSADVERLVVYEVTVNGESVGSWPLIARQDGWFASEEALRAWRVLVRDDAPRLARHAQRWLALNSLPGYRTQEDPTSQTLALYLNPIVFETTRLSSDAAATPGPSPVEPALFLNLEVNYTRIQARHTGSPQDLSAFSEIGWSSAAGVLTSTVIGRQALGGNGGQSGMPDWVRLETTFTRQGLEGEPTLRVGDSVTRTGLTGRSVYFGGLQWGTDNDAATGVGRGPRSVIGGTAATPGTVELFVNDVLRQTARVPSGPFAIDVPPLLGSDGQVRVVVRDLMGRETVIAQPIFQVTNQLEEGSRDWNVAVGAVRQRLGLRSNDYGERFAAGLLRMSLNKTLTTEWQGHWSEQSKSLGMGISWALPHLGLGFLAGLTASRGRDGTAGGEWLMGAEMRRGPHSARLRITRRDTGHRALGEAFGQAMTSAIAHYALAVGPGTTLGLGMARVQPLNQAPIATYSVSVGKRLAGGASVNVIAARTQGQVSASQLTLAFQMPLPGQTAHTLHLARRNNALDAYVSASGSEDRTSWRVQAGRQDDRDHAEAGLWQVTDTNLWSANLSANAQSQALRLGWQGGLVAMGGRVHATRKVNGSFALVEVPGIEGAQVGPYGDKQTTTASDGFALVTDLTPNVPTPVRLDPESLPLGADVPTLESIAVPRWRSGVRLRFPVRAGRSALVQLRSPNGLPLRAGTEVKVDNALPPFLVGPRGEAFITGLTGLHRLSVQGDGINCHTQLAMPTGSMQEVERIGPLTCLPTSP